jgi:putative membrane protein
MSDPRVFFAAQRTLLAWIRTGITVMALGFVVAKFGLFLRIISSSIDRPRMTSLPHPAFSATFGIALTLLGAISIGLAVINHVAFLRSLPRADIPRAPIPWLTSFLAAALAVTGLLLAVYLAFT